MSIIDRSVDSKESDRLSAGFRHCGDNRQVEGQRSLAGWRHADGHACGIPKRQPRGGLPAHIRVNMRTGSPMPDTPETDITVSEHDKKVVNAPRARSERWWCPVLCLLTQLRMDIL